MPKCTNFESVFAGCTSLSDFKFAYLGEEAGSVNMSSAFKNCKSLPEVLNLDEIGDNSTSAPKYGNFQNVTKADNMLANTNIKELTCTLPEVTSMNLNTNFVRGCSNLRSINASLPGLLTIYELFYNSSAKCWDSLEKVHLNVPSAENMQRAFRGCSGLR